MRNLRVILIIFTVALLIIIGLIIIKFHKPNKLNVSENVIKGYDISFKNEEQTKTFIDSNYNLKAAAALDKVYRDEHITPDNQEEFEKIFKAAYESISDEEINNEKTEKLQVLNELITDKAKSNFVMDNCEPYIKGLIDNNNFDAMILVCNTRRAIDIGNMDYHGINSTIFPWMNVYILFEKYDIHDSIDLIKFYEKHYQFKQNLFTNSNDIKINYIARNYSNFTIPSYDTFYYLENDLRGYTIEYKRNKDKYFQQTVLSYKDGMYSENNYGVSFYNNKEEYFNHENSMEIVSSISR